MLQTRNCVYMLTSKITGKSYIGKTEQTLHRRLKNHDNTKHIKTNIFHNYLKTYGMDSLEIKLLYVAPNQGKLSHDERMELINKEIEYIAKYQTQDRQYGYNMLAGGEGGAGDDVVRAKISASSIERWQNPEMREKIISGLRKYYKNHSHPNKGKGKSKQITNEESRLRGMAKRRARNAKEYKKFTKEEIQPVIEMLKSGLRPRHILAKGISKELLNKAQREFRK